MGINYEHNQEEKYSCWGINIAFLIYSSIFDRIMDLTVIREYVPQYGGPLKVRMKEHRIVKVAI